MPHSQSLTGILVVTHGDFGKNLLEAAQLINQSSIADVDSISVKAEYDRAKITSLLHKHINKLSKHSKDIVVMFDTNGCTAARLIAQENFEDINIVCVNGVNLPMLLECIYFRQKTDNLDELVTHILKSGRDAICNGKVHGD